MSPRTTIQTEGINVERAKVDSILIYDVTEEELNSLEIGNQELSTDSNSFYALLSIVVSIGISLFTTTMTDRIFAIFMSAEIACVILLFYIGRNWRIHCKEKNKVISRIKERAQGPKLESIDEESVQPVNYNEKSDSES